MSWKLATETVLGLSFECYDISHLYNLAHFADRGLVKAPFFVQSVFGLLGGIGAHHEDILHMKRTADRLFGMISAGLFWVLVPINSELQHKPQHWGEMYEWALKTVFGLDVVNLPPQMLFRFVKSETLLKILD